MKKFFTLSLVALLALSASAKKPQGQKAFRQAPKLELSTNRYTTAHQNKAVSAELPKLMIKGNRVIAPKNVYPYDANYGAAFERPINSFWIGISSEGYSLNKQYLVAQPYSTLNFVNRSFDTFQWAYMDIDTEELLTSDATDLEMTSKAANVINAPALIQPGNLVDTVYNIADNLQIAGEGADWRDDGYGLFGFVNYNMTWDEHWWYNTRYFGMNSATTNSTFTQEYADQGVDTVKVVAYAERLDKPTSPYILSDVHVPMICMQSGELTLKVYRAIQDESGNWTLGEQLAESTATVDADDENSLGPIFEDLVYVDPETGLDGVLMIDDNVFVVVEGDIESYPLHWYHMEELPSEAHAYQIMSFTVDGEEFTDVMDCNFGFGDGSSVTCYAFNYNIFMYYLHNNEETDTYNAPAEGGSMTFNYDSYYSSGGWDITDTNFEDLPEWVTVETEDGTVQNSDGTLGYTGITDVTVTVEALPEGVESRSVDILLSYDGAESIIHVIQGEAPVVVVPGDVNGDGVVTSADVTALYKHILYNDDSDIVNGDQTGDGFITTADVTAVYKIILGI